MAEPPNISTTSPSRPKYKGHPSFFTQCVIERGGFTVRMVVYVGRGAGTLVIVFVLFDLGLLFA